MMRYCIYLTFCLFKRCVIYIRVLLDIGKSPFIKIWGYPGKLNVCRKGLPNLKRGFIIDDTSTFHFRTGLHVLYVPLSITCSARPSLALRRQALFLVYVRDRCKTDCAWYRHQQSSLPCLLSMYDMVQYTYHKTWLSGLCLSSLDQSPDSFILVSKPNWTLSPLAHHFRSACNRFHNPFHKKKQCSFCHFWNCYHSSAMLW